MVSFRRLLLAGLVIVLGGLLAWLDWRTTPVAKIDQDARAEEPGHVVENATLTIYNDQGKRSQRLSAEQLTHTPQHNMTQLTSPYALLLDDQQREWHAQAQHGQIDSQGARLTLSGEVRLREPQETWQLSTEQLSYISAETHAFSDVPVLFEQPPQSVQAQRMDLWLNKDLLQLSGGVHGNHPTENAP
ncbi:LPS export ABC transporter periplasmic protein LptC [Halomonas sp. LS-001]